MSGHSNSGLAARHAHGRVIPWHDRAPVSMIGARFTWKAERPVRSCHRAVASSFVKWFSLCTIKKPYQLLSSCSRKVEEEGRTNAGQSWKHVYADGRPPQDARVECSKLAYENPRMWNSRIAPTAPCEHKQITVLSQSSPKCRTRRKTWPPHSSPSIIRSSILSIKIWTEILM